MIPESLPDVLGRDPKLSQLFARVVLAQKADTVLKAALPGALAAGCRVLRLTEGEVLVFARHGGVATKLKLMHETLVLALQRRGLPVTSLCVKMHVDTPPPPRPAKTVVLSPRAAVALHTAAAHISSPMLKAALERLARQAR